MKVRELIEQLNRLNPEAEVLKFNHDNQVFSPCETADYLYDNQNYVILYENPSMELRPEDIEGYSTF